MAGNRLPLIGLVVIVTALALAAPKSTLADWRKGYVPQRSEDRAPRARRPPVTLDNAVEDVRSRRRGRVLSAESTRRKGRDVHRIKILTDDGRVRNLYMDPETGKIIPR